MIKIKNEADIAHSLGIKSETCEPINVNQKEKVSERESKIQTPAEEKSNLIETIISLKNENQQLHFQLNEKNAEIVKMKVQFEQNTQQMNDEIVTISSKLKSVEFEAAELQKKFNEKQQSDKKIIDDMKAEKRIMIARMKQLQSGTFLNLENEKEKSDGENVYEVDRLIDDKIIDKIRHYRVRWRGYGPGDDTWEKAENLMCPSILQEYLQLKSE